VRKLAAKGQARNEETLVRWTREAWDELPQAEIDRTVRHFTTAVRDWYDAQP
jgi:hypothetical protein